MGGVLTFDGNTRLPQKVTYERIRLHLEKVYQRHFSYGSTVQLCVARNKRRLSAKRYGGIAKVTTRRARKGFTLWYNPDSHWSSAFYKGLNSLQLKDGRDICLINRDDASGFRLDTLTTCKQYAMALSCCFCLQIAFLRLEINIRQGFFGWIHDGAFTTPIQTSSVVRVEVKL